MRILFLAHTPYHLLLAVSLLNNYKKETEKTLIIHKDFIVKKNMIKNLNAVFSNIYIIDSKNKHNKNRIFSNYFYKLKIINDVKNYIEFDFYDEVFVFNDNNVIDKKIIQLTNDNNSLVYYIEDGSAAYNSIISEKRNFWNLFKTKIKRFIFGLREFGLLVEVIGANSYIDRVIVMFPELIRKELQGKKISGIDKIDFVRGIDTFYLNESINCKLTSNSTIIFLDLSTFVENVDVNYVELIERIILLYNEMGKNVFVKYHPRETFFYLEEIAISNYSLINNDIPSEVIMRICKSETIVLASMSTTLLTATLFQENIRPISFLKLINYEDTSLQHVFKKFNIFMPTSLEELSIK